MIDWEAEDGALMNEMQVETVSVCCLPIFHFRLLTPYSIYSTYELPPHLLYPPSPSITLELLFPTTALSHHLHPSRQRDVAFGTDTFGIRKTMNHNNKGILSMSLNSCRLPGRRPRRAQSLASRNLAEEEDSWRGQLQVAANARAGEELLCSIMHGCEPRGPQPTPPTIQYHNGDGILLPEIMTNCKDGNSKNEFGQPSWVNTPKPRTFQQLEDAGVKVRQLVSEVKRKKSIPSRRVGECIISRSKQWESESASPFYASY